MFTIEFSKEAFKILSSMPRNTAQRIREKIDALAQNPYVTNNNVKKLEGEPGYRLRVGDWRIIYDIIDDQLIIEVIRIRPRGGAYK